MPKLRARAYAWLAALLLVCAAGLTAAQELQPVPPLVAHVTDLTGTLTTGERDQLESRLAAFEREKGAQIALLLVATVKPEAIEQYALRVAEAWKLGRKGVDDGALLLVAKEDRKLRIEVGYGLEGALNDATAKRIVAETIGPRFKQGDFYGGLDAGVGAMIKVIGGEPLPPPKARAAERGDNQGGNFETLLTIGFVLVFVVGGIVRAIFGRFLGAGLLGVAAGFIASLLLSSLLIGVIAGVAAFLFSLLAGASLGRPFGGGLGGGSWGGGGGFGGFSGGGGGFGGGGASGDW